MQLPQLAFCVTSRMTNREGKDRILSEDMNKIGFTFLGIRKLNHDRVMMIISIVGIKKLLSEEKVVLLKELFTCYLTSINNINLHFEMFVDRNLSNYI